MLSESSAARRCSPTGAATAGGGPHRAQEPGRVGRPQQPAGPLLPLQRRQARHRLHRLPRPAGQLRQPRGGLFVLRAGGQRPAAAGERTGAVHRRCLSGDAWAQPGDPAAAWCRWNGAAPAGVERGGGAAELLGPNHQWLESGAEFRQGGWETDKNRSQNGSVEARNGPVCTRPEASRALHMAAHRWRSAGPHHRLGLRSLEYRCIIGVLGWGSDARSRSFLRHRRA